MLYFLQQVLNGFHSSALYALLAFGYALTHGVLHRTNIAYGSLFAFAGQTMILTAVFGYQVLWLTLPATVAFGIAVGLPLRLADRPHPGAHVLAPLAASSPNAIVVVTLGVSMVLTEARPDFGRHARLLAAADAVHAGRVRRRRRLPGDADR